MDALLVIVFFSMFTYCLLRLAEFIAWISVKIPKPKTNLTRHVAALLITVGIYYSPLLISVTGDQFWVRSSSLSLLYMLLIYNFAKTRITCYLLSIEFVAMAWNLAAWYEFKMSPESQLFQDHYGFIMSYCYALEVLTIMGAALSGRFKRIYHNWIHTDRNSESNRSIVLTSESHICTSPQKVFFTR